MSMTALCDPGLWSNMIALCDPGLWQYNDNITIIKINLDVTISEFPGMLLTNLIAIQLSYCKNIDLPTNLLLQYW